jgi:hypothetical protein
LSMGTLPSFIKDFDAPAIATLPGAKKASI